MKLRRLLASLLLFLLLTYTISNTVHAADTPVVEKGLMITPLRQFLSADAGTTLRSSFTVANLTNEPLTVNTSVKEFSVTDYAYDYTFQNPQDDWLHLQKTSVTLQPNQSSTIPYTIAVPAKSAPGGQYYTLFASANLSSQGVSSVIQAADLVYLTVNGKLTTVSHLQSSSIQWFSFGKNIAYSLRPVNTGNVHSFVYVSGQLHGLFVKPPATSGAHLLMPGKVRDLNDSIPAPILPGIYRATYGYKTEGGWVVQASHWVIYIPPWSIAFLLAALLIAGKFWTHKKRTNTDGTPAEDNER